MKKHYILPLAVAALASCADQETAEPMYEESICHLQSEPVERAQNALEETLARIEGAKFDEFDGLLTYMTLGDRNFVGRSQGDDIYCHVSIDHRDQETIRKAHCHTCDIDRGNTDEVWPANCTEEDLGFYYGNPVVFGTEIAVGFPYSFAAGSYLEDVGFNLKDDGQWQIEYRGMDPQCSDLTSFSGVTQTFTSTDRGGRQMIGHWERQIIETVTNMMRDVEEERNQ